MVNDHNIESNFSGLTFDEENHRYFVDNKPLKGSVSTMIEDFYEPFPEDEAIQRTMAKTGKGREEILKEWKDINEESTERGHRVHVFAEKYPFNKKLKPQCPQEAAAKKFWDEMPEWIIPVSVELRMYHKRFMFPGTADLLLFDTKSQGYIIADYKTNKDLHKNFKGKRMLFPFEYLLDSPINHYQVQLSFYQIMLEQLGIHVISRKVIYLDFNGNYKMYECNDLTMQLKDYLNFQHNIN